VTRDDGPGRRILLIAYHFPPSAAIGGMRMANFAKWLPCHGWEPHVLTIEDRDVEHMDPDRLRDVEGIAIVKAGVLPTLADRYGAIKSWITGLAKPASAAASEAGPRAGLSLAPARRESLADRLKRYLNSFVTLPDYERGWIGPAVLAARRLLRRRRIGLIMTSCPPYSGHLVGLAVKVLTGARWVADFRDPWMTIGMKRSYATCALSIRIESWLERKVIEKADLLVFNVERMKEAYAKRYARVAQHKFVYIPNGIDLRALAALPPVPKYEKFTLSYTGSLYVRRSPEPVFRALSLLIQEGRLERGSVCIKLVGQCRSVDGVPIDALIRKYDLDSVVEVSDPLPYSAVLEIVRRSQLALLFAPDLPFQIPAKAYDYLGAGARILAIADEGATSDLVHSTGSGQAFAPGDVAGIKAFIDREIDARTTGQSRATGLCRFDVQRIATDLAGHLERIADTRAADANHP
jgi:glycosyltransferase involved in cell wall biosynthesis